MNADLQAITDAMDMDREGGRDRDLAVELSDDYVAAHPDEFSEMEPLTLEECVQAVEVFRNANMEDSRWRVEAWLLHRFEPQVIGGEYQPQIRVPGIGS